MRLRVFMLSILLLLLFISPTYAVSAPEIISMYGKSVTSQPRVKAPSQAEIDAVQEEIAYAEIATIYNNIITTYSTEGLEADINELVGTAENLADEIVNGIDLPFDELVKKEVSYRRASDKLTSLLVAKDFEAPEMVEIPGGDLDKLKQREASLLKQKAAAEAQPTYADIGKKNYYPVVGTQYKINSLFGYRNDPVGQKGWSLHSGIDLKAANGTPIGAWFNGTVSSAGYSGTSGYYVWVNHGYGLQTFYCHLSSIKAKVGQTVKQGDIIALSGATGSRCTGPHLHLSVKINGSWVDPKVVLG